ncbi:single stranded DNA-binding domain-containing protein [Arthrobacter sp. HLT1-20]
MPTLDGDWPPAVAINELPQRGRAVCCGVVDAVTILPASATPAYTAIVTDRESRTADPAAGNHRLRLVWIGRRRVPGIAAGTRLRVEGMVSLRQGLPTMYNPRYEIIGTQES